MTAAEEQGSYEERLQAKLQPTRVRSTLAFAGLYQLTHELLKSSILDDLKGFYGYVDLGERATWLPEQGEEEYRHNVLARDPTRPFRSSLLWLQEMGALDSAEAERLDVIYAHRHELAHNLARYLIDPDFEPDIDLFVDALKTLRKISRFWTEVEHSLGTFEEFPNLDLHDVVPGRLAVLDLCIGAYTKGLGA